MQHTKRFVQNRSLVSSMIKKLNNENAEERKDLMFEKMIEKKRDNLNFVNVEMHFSRFDTSMYVRSWNDKKIFKVSTKDYFGFKKNMGHIPMEAEATWQGRLELSSEMTTWALKFLAKNNIKQIVFLTKGTNEFRSRVMQIAWDNMDIIHYIDITRLCWSNPRRRRPHMRGVKRHYRPKSVYPMSYY